MVRSAGYRNSVTCKGACGHRENSLMVIKAAAETQPWPAAARAAAVNRREMKVYEIIDARSKGRQLRETKGGTRKGLLIRAERFDISVRPPLCQDTIKKPPSPSGGDGRAFIFRGVLLFSLNSDEDGRVWFHTCWGFLVEHE